MNELMNELINELPGCLQNSPGYTGSVNDMPYGQPSICFVYSWTLKCDMFLEIPWEDQTENVERVRNIGIVGKVG